MHAASQLGKGGPLIYVLVPACMLIKNLMMMMMMYAHSYDSKVILQNNVGLQSNTGNRYQWCGTFFFFFFFLVVGVGRGCRLHHLAHNCWIPVISMYMYSITCTVEIVGIRSEAS